MILGVFMIELLWGYYLFDEFFVYGLCFYIYYVENKIVFWYFILDYGKSYFKIRFNLGLFKRGCKN